MKKLALFLLLQSFCLLSVRAQITGQLVDAETNEPIVSASLVLLKDGKTVAYTISNKEGRFKLKECPPPFVIKIRHLSYGNQTISYETYKAQSKHVFSLQSKDNKLKQVVVTSPVIQQHGDTTRYRLGAYATKGDVNLEDALKRLPGVSVDKSGTIKYLGKNIDKMTIDGMNLTGTKYEMATRNLSHKKVAAVEIMENQQEIKQLKDIISDDKLVMNIVLNKKARNRLNGRIDGRIGAEGKEPVYYGGATTMLFKPNLQVLASGILNKNAKEHPLPGQRFNSDKVGILSSQGIRTLSPLSESIGTSEMAPRPSLSEDYYLHRKDAFVNLNALYKFANQSKLRVITGYTKTKKENAYESTLHYLSAQANSINIHEEAASGNEVSIPTLSVEYILNNDRLYLYNKTLYEGHWDTDNYRLQLPRRLVQQELAQTRQQFSNELNGTRRNGGTVYSWKSRLQYDRYPLWRLRAGDRLQNFSGHSILGQLSLSPSWRLGKTYRFYTPVATHIYKNRIENETNWGTDVRSYDLTDWKWTVNVSPRIERFLPGFYNISLSMPFVYQNEEIYTEQTQAEEVTLRRLYWNPSFSFWWNVRPSIRVSGDASRQKTSGSMLNFLPGVLYKSYRSSVKPSGILPETDSKSASVRLQYRRPLKEFYATVGIHWNRLEQSYLLSDAPEAEKNETELIDEKSRNDNYQLNLSLSQYIRSIHSKISASGSYNKGGSQMYRNQILQPFHYEALTGSINILSNPKKWIETKYNISLVKNTLSYNNDTSKRSLMTFSQEAEIKLLPYKGFSCAASLEHLGKEITEGTYAHILLPNAKAEWKQGMFIIELEAKNLLNRTVYAYSLLNELSFQEMKYLLRSRTLQINLSYYF